MTEEDRKATPEESLINFLPEWHEPFTKSSAYKDLAKAVEALLTCKIADLAQKKLELLHAKSVYDDLIAKDPERLLQIREEEAKAIQEKKGKRLNEIYEAERKAIK